MATNRLPGETLDEWMERIVREMYGDQPTARPGMDKDGGGFLGALSAITDAGSAATGKVQELLRGAQEFSEEDFKEGVGPIRRGVANAAGALEGIVFPNTSGARELRYDISGAPPIVQGALSGAKVLPGIGSVIDASVKGDPLEGTGWAAGRDIARTLGEMVLPVAGQAKLAVAAGKLPAAARTAAAAAAAQELKARGIEQPVQSAVNVGAAAAGARLGVLTDKVAAAAKTPLGSVGRALAAETAIEAGTGLPAAVVNTAPILKKHFAGEELTDEDRAALISEAVASLVAVGGGSIGGAVGGRALRLERARLERARLEQLSNDDLVDAALRRIPDVEEPIVRLAEPGSPTVEEQAIFGELPSLVAQYQKVGKSYADIRAGIRASFPEELQPRALEIAKNEYRLAGDKSSLEPEPEPEPARGPEPEPARDEDPDVLRTESALPYRLADDSGAPKPEPEPEPEPAIEPGIRLGDESAPYRIAGEPEEPPLRLADDSGTPEPEPALEPGIRLDPEDPDYRVEEPVVPYRLADDTGAPRPEPEPEPAIEPGIRLGDEEPPLRLAEPGSPTVEEQTITALHTVAKQRRKAGIPLARAVAEVQASAPPELRTMVAELVRQEYAAAPIAKKTRGNQGGPKAQEPARPPVLDREPAVEPGSRTVAMAATKAEEATAAAWQASARSEATRAALAKARNVKGKRKEALLTAHRAAELEASRAWQEASRAEAEWKAEKAQAQEESAPGTAGTPTEAPPPYVPRIGDEVIVDGQRTTIKGVQDDGSIDILDSDTGDTLAGYEYKEIAPVKTTGGGKSKEIRSSAATVKTPPTEQQRAILEAKLSEIVGRVAGKDATVDAFLRESITDSNGRPLAGRYDESSGEVEVSQLAKDFEGAAYKEAYHRAAGRVMDKEDLARVRRLVAKGGEFRKRLVDAVKNDEMQDANSRAAVLADIDRSAAEAEGYAFEYWTKGELRAPTVVGRLWEGVREFVDRLKSALRGKGFVSDQDVFRSLQSNVLATNRRAKPFGVQSAAHGIEAALQKMASTSGAPAKDGTTIDSLVKYGTRAMLKLATEVTPGAPWRGIGYNAALDRAVSRELLSVASQAGLHRELRQAFAQATAEQRAEAWLYTTNENYVPANMTPAQIEASTKTRQMVDDLSEQIVLEGVPSEVIRKAIENNAGKYLARTYRVDSDKNWTQYILEKQPEQYRTAKRYFADLEKLRTVGLELREKAPKELRKGGVEADADRFHGESLKNLVDIVQGKTDVAGVFVPTSSKVKTKSFPLLSDEQVGKAISARDIEDTTEILGKAEGYIQELFALREAGEIGDASSGKRSMALGRFMRRTFLPEEIRDLYGEIKDVEVAASKTIYDMTNILNKNRFFSEILEMRRANGDRYVYDQPNPKAGAVRELKGGIGPEPHRFGALTGKYTTREVYEALTDTVANENDWIAGLAKGVTRAFQKAQTVYSTGTQIRNHFGNATVFATLANVSPFNPLNWKYYKRAYTAYWDTLKGIENQDFLDGANDGANAKQFVSLPSVEDSLRRIQRSLDSGEGPAKAMGDIFDKVKSVAGKVDSRMTQLYLFGDQWYRLASYLKRRELNIKSKGKGDYKSPLSSGREAAEWTNAMFVDYARLPRAAERWQYGKTGMIASPFLSFWLDSSTRVLGNAALKNPIKLAMVVGMVPALAAASQFMSDLSDEDTASLNRMVPDYHKGAGNVWFKGAGGKVFYINTENLFPIEGTKALVKNWDFGNLLLGGPIPSAAMLLVANRDVSGITTLPDDATVGEKTTAALSHVATSMMPPLAGVPGTGLKGYEYKRIEKGLSGEADRFGRRQDLGEALMSPGTGIRPYRVFWDVLHRQSLLDINRGMSNRLNAAKRVIHNPQASVEKKLAEAEVLQTLYDKMQEEFRQAVDDYRTAVRLGGEQTGRRSQNVKDSRRAYKATMAQIKKVIGDARRAEFHAKIASQQ